MQYTSFENTIYIFDIKTKEFTGESKAYRDPEESKKNNRETYTCSTNSTFQKPPEIKENEILIYDFENDSWIIKKDFRGKEYYLPNGNKIIITNIDELIPEDAILEPPPNSLITKPKYENNQWVESGLIYKGIEVKTKKDVDNITKTLIRNIGEEKAKTEKLIAGNNECEIWNKFLEDRELIIKEGNDFIKENNLEDFIDG
jgi:hypothetical protein